MARKRGNKTTELSAATADLDLEPALTERAYPSSAAGGLAVNGANDSALSLLTHAEEDVVVLPGPARQGREVHYHLFPPATISKEQSTKVKLAAIRQLKLGSEDFRHITHLITSYEKGLTWYEVADAIRELRDAGVIGQMNNMIFLQRNLP